MRARIAVCHPYLDRGGSEARALWLIQALRELHDVTLITLGPVDLERLNRYYGTALVAEDFSLARPRLGGWLGRRRRGFALRGALLQRFAASRAARYDLMVSAYNPLDFGVGGIQFIADLGWLTGGGASTSGSYQYARGGVGRWAYDALVRRVAGYAGVGILREDDVVVANSRFVAGVLRNRLGRTVDHVINPPVVIPTHEDGVLRTSNFVSLGRISPEKRIEDQIAILEGVRASGYDVRLTILGGPMHGSYADAVRSEVDARSWVHWEGWVEGPSKWNHLRAHMFGIHTRPGEAFGIAIPEMLRAGCVPFVPEVGAPAETVAAPELQFADIGDAIRKIRTVLEDADAWPRLAAHGAHRAQAYSPEAFQHAALQLIEGQLASRSRAPCSASR